MPLLQNFSGPNNFFNIVNTGIACLPNVIQHMTYPSLPAIDSMPICQTGDPCYAAVASCDSALANVAAFNTTASSSTITWESNVAAIKYRVRVKNMATGITGLYFVPAPNVTKLLTGLSPNTLYKIQVRSQCSTNGSILSPWSTSVYFTTQSSGLACAAPSNVTASSTSNSAALFSWVIVPGAAGYQLRYRPQGTTTWTPVVINDGMVNAANISGLLPNTTYQYQIRTKCSLSPLSWSTYSIILTFVTPLRINDSAAAAIAVYPNLRKGWCISTSMNYKER